jgi:hypothetical protein
VLSAGLVAAGLLEKSSDPLLDGAPGAAAALVLVAAVLLFLTTAAKKGASP